MLPAAVRGGVMGERVAKIFGYILCAVLLIGSSQAYPAQQEGKKAIPEVCKQVEAYGNGQPHDLTIHKIRREFDDKYRETFGDVADVLGEVFLDINNDGKQERVLLQEWLFIRDVESGIHDVRQSIFVLDKLTGRSIRIALFKTDDEEDDMDAPKSYEFISYQGENYLVGQSESLDYVARVNRQNKREILCEFEQKEQPLLTLLKSENAVVCKMALENKIQYVAFTEPHSLVLDKSPDSGVLYDGIALIDIDNDGRKKPVISMWEHAGKGCMIDYLQVLTEDRKAINKTYSDKLPERLCRTTTKAFVFNETTYLARLNEYGNNQLVETVFQLNKDKLQTICEIEAKPINYIK